MKFDSPLFDRIRVKPDEDRRPRADAFACEWAGCSHAATHRAPKGRGNEREYWRFCLDHVREYNQSYNYFAGMSDAAVANYQKDALTGHRPTWRMGMNGRGATRRPQARTFEQNAQTSHDPFDLFSEIGTGGSTRQQSRAYFDERPVRNAERKALDTLGLENGATAADIKGRFKALVKQHHPDANGGDRSCEDRLREIIQAYNYLKSVGFC